MITDNQTNVVFFSSLLKSRFPSLWDKIEPLLKERKIDFHFIENTRDIWCRDYMPIQVDENNFVQFQYFPDYYLTPKQVKFLTLQDEIHYDLDISIKKVELIVDGGNIVKSRTKAFMTEKVISDNKKKHSEKVTLEILRKELQVDEIFIIPRQPNDWSGHADGMVRFYDEDTLIVNDFSLESPSWKKRFDAAIKKTGLKIIELPYVHSERRSEDGENTAHGCYINFAQVDDTILFPQFGKEFSNYDALALNKAKELFEPPKYHVEPINADSIAFGGGVLNCCTWNIYKPIIENAIERIIPVCKMGDLLLIILDEDFQRPPVIDTVCIQISLRDNKYFEPWSIAKSLKHMEEFSDINSIDEIAEAREKISKSFTACEITDIYNKLKSPSDIAIESLVSIPKRIEES
jgi:agmatine deiminase